MDSMQAADNPDLFTAIADFLQRCAETAFEGSITTTTIAACDMAICLALLDTPLTACELAALLGRDPGDLDAALRTLTTLGIIERTGFAYSDSAACRRYCEALLRGEIS